MLATNERGLLRKSRGLLQRSRAGCYGGATSVANERSGGLLMSRGLRCRGVGVANEPRVAGEGLGVINEPGSCREASG